MDSATANLSNPGASATSMQGASAVATPAPASLIAAPAPQWIVGAAVLAAVVWLFSKKG